MKAIPNLLLLSLVHFIVFLKPVKAEQTAVKALFVFGDSFVDSGNNNYIEDTDAKGDYPPYGVDFPLGPTGRITNGRNPADVLAEHLGIPDYLPVFNNPQTKGGRILHGVNYASAGAGILDTTFVAWHIIPLSHQVENFLNVTLPELEAELNDASHFMSHAIFMFVIGGNDYNYVCFESSDSCDFEELTSILIGNYTVQLEKLYSAGARKFVLYNIQPSGCSPGSRIQNDGQCVKEYNDAMVLFNNHLNASLDDFTVDMPGSVFVYVNTYNIISQVIDEPASFGIEVINVSCCYVESTKGLTCEEYGSSCSNRSIYLYYDRVHPTEKVYNSLSTRAYLSNLSSEVHPINVKTLANITFNTTLCNVSYKLWPVEGLNNKGLPISGQEELWTAS
ncbi:GDSL esterase/lipase [Nymphaea thermarum]|nr:GDSL esterase/lipase [Nymphaea thermarum]